ncbi:tRNA N(3)-methylcytidine methyltransferase METTL2-like isoform X2 [Dreissena polymorpha]|uniref:tRNA N(3)-methylcytidine methyltransferase METTL2-like isoform X2 n=1 Tax=Dreissena polymorpha TaxID=45954 RepID=UPI0022649ACF|nr:tRNA N(3)-methylcytidine methyltransferase METTL2-like isoform X2 [Dreissena polymorpha]
MFSRLFRASKPCQRGSSHQLLFMAEFSAENQEYNKSLKRQQFGNRFLTDPKTVFEHNSWDNVIWDEAQEAEARRTTQEQLAHLATEADQEKYENEADQFWDKFYSVHENKFFKDRHWLFTEFPELAPEYYQSTENKPTYSLKETNVDTCHSENQKPSKEPKDVFQGQSAQFRIFEVGCGVGNTVFPILKANNDKGLMVYCCDFAKTAVDMVKESKEYEPERCQAFLCDISDPMATVPFPDNSLDVIILIFVLSAISPDKFQSVICRLAGFLKPGGVILFRDYGRYDLAQLRFKKGRCLGENFYARGDGTRVYFFTQDELREIMGKAGLHEKQNFVDRRLQVNRGRQIKMYRVWIQCKYVKPLLGDTSHVKPLLGDTSQNINNDTTDTSVQSVGSSV